jgi:hypothetical protein
MDDQGFVLPGRSEKKARYDSDDDDVPLAVLKRKRDAER